MALFSKKNKKKNPKQKKRKRKEKQTKNPSSFVLWQMAPEKMPDMGASKNKKKIKKNKKEMY